MMWLHVEREFQIGDWVYLRLQPYRQAFVSLRRNLKLSPRYFGPFKILARIGVVAYKLELPPESRIHPIFHISLLKKKIGCNVEVHTQLPEVQEDRRIVPRLKAILDKRTRKN
ncbi:hypothetical protein Pint_05376 [Pistacia integerrima]|uniref:Uncharacterized protein n=1 Tax=Pistacia integerrima TaxID=434235 RepID=A0ACC0Z3Z5_9ROSI|nr:hypothetical protein Pint_05376 [Pistacia integerrima]